MPDEQTNTAEPTATPQTGGVDPSAIDWDSLFAPEEGAVPAATTPAEKPASPNSQVQPQPATPSPEEFYLKTETGTVYKNKEDALQGIARKDTLIEQLRTRIALQTGIDPVTGQSINLQNQPPKSYLENRKAYFQDLLKAANENNEEAYLSAQQKLIQDTLAPLAPVIRQLAKSNALDSLNQTIPEFRQFYSGDDYQKTLEEFPELKNAIQLAEQDPQFAPRLSELYRIAYMAGQGRRLPELLKANQQGTQKPNPQAAARPTMSPQALPTPELAPSLREAILNSPENRERFIKEFEARGNMKLPG